MKTKKAFSLIEVMVAIALLAIASGVIGLKMHKMIETKHFQSDIDRLMSRIKTAHTQSMALQSDWSAQLLLVDKQWRLTMKAVDGERHCLPPIKIDWVEITLDGKKVNELEFNFYSSGKVEPDGMLQFKRGPDEKQVCLGKVFRTESGNKAGPAHPAD